MSDMHPDALTCLAALAAFDDNDAPWATTSLPSGAPSPLTHRGDSDLAERVATVGPAAVEGELRRFIREARRRNVTPLLRAILADPAQPEVARQRAFGRIHAELEQPRRTAPSTVPSDYDAA